MIRNRVFASHASFAKVETKSDLWIKSGDYESD